MIKGEILAPVIGETAGIHLERPFPLIFDGGCAIVTVDYDVGTGTLKSRCHGLG